MPPLTQTQRTRLLLGTSIAFVAGIAAAALTARAEAPPDAAAVAGVLRGDSAFVHASWSSGCDQRGCPTSYEVTWVVGDRSLRRMVPVPRDSLAVAWPAWDDSVFVAIAVRAQRRNKWSPPATSGTWVTRLDAPPPAVDSLQLHPDTLAAVAWRDSFPASSWQTIPGSLWQHALEDGTDSIPVPSWENGPVLTPGYGTPFCSFAVNRYTGVTLLFMPQGLSDSEQAETEAMCRPRIAAFRAARGS